MGGNSSKTMTTNLNENLTVISQQPFAFTLINLLKDKGVITTGITIPFIIGAYKIAKHDSIEVNLKFIQEVFADIVATAKDTKFFICLSFIEFSGFSDNRFLCYYGFFFLNIK